MKTLAFIFICFSSFTLSTEGEDCKLHQLFPCQFFDSRFDTEQLLQSSPSFQVQSRYSEGWWDYPQYLNGDSVYYNQIRCSVNSSCITTPKVNASFMFCDDKLYGFFLEADYSQSELAECLTDYEKVADMFIPTLSAYKEVNVKNSDTKEKIGEAWKFYRSFDELVESKYTTARVEYVRTRNGYTLNVSYKNFDEVKIDNRGFIAG